MPQPSGGDPTDVYLLRSRALRPGGAIRHPEWASPRIDFIPYPYPSYTEALVRFLQTTYVEGERAFLERLNPDTAHRQLVDDTLVRKALEDVGGLKRLWVARAVDAAAR